MTTYGTIPTAEIPPGSSNLVSFSRAKAQMKESLAMRRPWREMIGRHVFGLPSSFRDAMSRIRTNLGYFRVNYAIVVLVIVFLSLLWHPISLIVFVAMMVAWLFLYFMRDEPLVLCNRTIDDRVVLLVLSVVTIVALLLTHATLNIVVSLLVGLLLVLIHAVFRKTDDLLLDEQAAGSGGLLVGAAGPGLALRDPSSYF